jgi:hypothetical protein
MNRLSAIVGIGAALALGACAPTEDAATQETAAAQESAVPSIEGTYRLVARELPDGTRIVPPDVVGLLTYTKQYRNFNIMWQDADGNRLSISYIARYSLTDTDYSEESVYRMVNDEISGAGITYDLSGTSGSSPVTITDGRVELTLPLYGEPNVAFDGQGVTAWSEGEFMDYWERVE